MMRQILGLPVLASDHGQDVDNLIIYVHWLMIALFIGWLAYFAYALLRFHRSRNPKADYLGVKGHASNYIEVAVAIVEAVLLIGVAVPLWAKAVDKFPSEQESTVIQVVGQQFQWNGRYSGKDGVFGKQAMNLVSTANPFGVDPNDPNGKDDVSVVSEMHCVVNKPVIAFISSKDVIHSFKIIAMRVTQDAIPGMRIPIWFRPTKPGKYQINCAQLCGNSHSAMSAGTLIVDTQEDYDKWLAASASAASPADLQ
jgi:cytochrome c oxidase subunit 2